MKKTFLLTALVFLVGCTYAGEKDLQTYIQQPRWLINDPHFAQYQEKRDAIEEQYLAKEITYVEYVEQIDALDAQYSKEVQARDAKIAD